MTAPTLMHTSGDIVKSHRKTRVLPNYIRPHPIFMEKMGGQVGDRGVMKYLDGGGLSTYLTQNARTALPVHLTKELTTGELYTISCPTYCRRRSPSGHVMQPYRNPPATRSSARSARLYVEQRGSYVSPKVLRFDFSHFQKLTPRKSEKVETCQQSGATRNSTRRTSLCAIDKAREMGAMALLRRKIWRRSACNPLWGHLSNSVVAHVENTGNIGMIKN